MSEQNLMRVKLIRKKVGGNFLTSYPLGTDGLLVDMISGLDLLEENRLGGNTYVIIDLISAAKIVVHEYYFSEPKENHTLEYMINEGLVTYRITTTITMPKTLLYLLTDLNGNYIMLNNNFFKVGQLDLTNTKVTSVLYKGNNTQLHTKNITFDESLSNKTYINESVDNVGGNN